MNLSLPSSAVGIIDSHAHVMTEYFQDEKDEVIERALKNHVKQMVNPAVTVEDHVELKELSEKNEQIFFALGQHPHEANKWQVEYADKIREFSKHSKMVAVGECGLDFYYEHSDKETQIAVFREQVKLAKELEKPLIVHCRDAWQEAFEVLREEKNEQLKGVFHCFTGGPELIPAIKEIDFYVSYSGIVTFKNARDIQDSVAQVPMDRILTETDCPYLAPQAVRGKRNEPAYVWWTVAKLAELKGMSVEELAPTLTKNTRTLFKLPA